MCSSGHASSGVPTSLATSTNYFAQADRAGPMMDEWKASTITSLRESAADPGHCQEFRDQCTKMADQLESGDCEI